MQCFGECPKMQVQWRMRLGWAACKAVSCSIQCLIRGRKVHTTVIAFVGREVWTPTRGRTSHHPPTAPTSQLRPPPTRVRLRLTPKHANLPFFRVYLHKVCTERDHSAYTIHSEQVSSLNWKRGKFSRNAPLYPFPPPPPPLPQYFLLSQWPSFT